MGKITVGGTIGFIVFTGLFFGLGTGALYLLIRRWLPRGRLGGLAFGGLLLVIAATRIEPLRRDNPDFDIVGPGWLNVAVFAALVVAHGIVSPPWPAATAASCPCCLAAGRPSSPTPRCCSWRPWRPSSYP